MYELGLGGGCHWCTEAVFQAVDGVDKVEHAATKEHSRRKEYRSAIYYFNEEMKSKIEAVMISLSQKRNETYITQIIPFVSFEPSWENVQNYYKTRPDAPFCKRYIEPKLEVVKWLSALL